MTTEPNVSADGVSCSGHPSKKESPDPWNPYSYLVGPFYALCAQAGIVSTMEFLRVYQIHTPEGLTMLIVCITYLTWLVLHFWNTFRTVVRIPEEKTFESTVGFIAVAASLTLFYVFGSMLDLITYDLLLVAILINLIRLIIPTFVLKGDVLDVVKLTPVDRWVWIFLNSLGIMLFAVLLVFFRIDNENRIAMSWLGVLFLLISVPSIQQWLRQHLEGPIIRMRQYFTNGNVDSTS